MHNLGYRPDALAFTVQFEGKPQVQAASRPATMDARRFGSVDACLDAFTDDASFKFAKRRDDRENHFAYAAAGVNIFTDGYEIDVVLAK